jgi:hypothetical protein
LIRQAGGTGDGKSVKHEAVFDHTIIVRIFLRR